MSLHTFPTYVDVLMVHAADPTTPFEETMKALHDLVVAGKVRYLGASNLRAWQFAEMNHVAELKGWTQFVCVEIEHSLLYRPEVTQSTTPSEYILNAHSPGERTLCVLQV